MKVSNVGIAETMFTVKGTGRGRFIAGQSVHNQRIEHLWRDVWLCVTQLYYEVLHSLEEDGLLDLSNSLHMFCVHYVFLFRLERDLQSFTEGWDDNPLRSEGGLTPNQLWIMGHMQNSSASSEEDLQICIKTLHLALNSCGAAYCLKLVVSCKVIECLICFRIWSCLEQTGSHLMEPFGVQVPQIENPLSPAVMDTVKSMFNPLAPSESYGRDIYISLVQYIESP